MKKALLAAAAIAALLAAAPAAQATEGWYVRGDVGYSVDAELEVEDGAFDLEDDWMASTALGYAYGNGFRAEGELAYRSNDVELADSGDVTAWSAMINGFYDFNRDGWIQPYVGVGVGAAQVDVSFSSGLFEFDQDDTKFAYQAMAGVGFPVNEQLTIDLGYRYFVAPDVEVSGLFCPEGCTEISGEGDYTHQAVTLGLRWQFAAPPPPLPPPPPPPPPTLPPPPPPPVACPTADFTVYFEWDRSNLNQAAIATIDGAVASARRCNLTAATVVGHTDTSGSTRYNVGLSERRSGVVSEALVARGIPAGIITQQARGETDLAQQTRDGVREPLNRRTAVTITFR